MRLEDVAMQSEEYYTYKVAERRHTGSSKARKFLKSHRDAIADYTYRENNKPVSTGGSRRDAT
jgi:hypothetical protein